MTARRGDQLRGDRHLMDQNPCSNQVKTKGKKKKKKGTTYKLKMEQKGSYDPRTFADAIEQSRTGGRAIARAEVAVQRRMRLPAPLSLSLFL